ncbi:MAG: DUF6157 family protein [Bacteroidota bacterium]
MHSTNYFNTFIEIAEDCPVIAGEVPPIRGEKKSIANLQYDMLAENPYQFSSDEVIFTIYAIRKDITESEMEAEREKFFSKGQPCLRSSPLTKRYGWGVHSNDEGKVAIYGAETEAYERLVQDPTIDKTKAMRSKRLKK